MRLFWLTVQDYHGGWGLYGTPQMRKAPFHRPGSQTEKEQWRRAWAFISLCFLTVDAMRPAASCFCHGDVPIVVDKSPSTASQSEPFLIRAFGVQPQEPLRVQIGHNSKGKGLFLRVNEFSHTCFSKPISLLSSFFFLPFWSFQFIYTHNQQFSGNSKITRLEFLKVVEQTELHKAVIVSLHHGSREARCVKCPDNSERQKGQLRSFKF